MGLVQFNMINTTALPRVDVLYAHQDMDHGLLLGAILLGAERLVVAGMGAGGV